MKSQRTKPAKPSKLYHFSPVRLKTVDPGKSKGKMRAGWFFVASEMEWAFQHVADHQGRERLYLHEVEAGQCVEFRKWRHGIYTCRSKVSVRCAGRFAMKVVKA